VVKGPSRPPGEREKRVRATFEFLKELRFKQARPTPLYHYRALQNLRDPLHFRKP